MSYQCIIPQGEEEEEEKKKKKKKVKKKKQDDVHPSPLSASSPPMRHSLHGASSSFLQPPPSPWSFSLFSTSSLPHAYAQSLLKPHPHAHALHPSCVQSDYISLLRDCNRARSLLPVHILLSQITLKGISLSGLLGEYLVVSLAKCGAVEDASLTFSGLCRRTVFSWTALISAYADSGQGRAALNCYQSMREEGVEANHYTYVGLLKACGLVSDVEMGTSLHADARSKGFASDIFVGNTLVSMYGKFGMISEAEDVFSAMVRHDVVSWTAMISVYLDVGEEEKSLMSYMQMRKEQVIPNLTTHIICLQVCSTLVEKEVGDDVSERSAKCTCLEMGLSFHADACRICGSLNALICNTLVSLYAKCCAIVEAENVLSALRQPHIVTCNSLLSAYVQQGDGEKALLFYKKMHEDGVTPELHTTVFALQACEILAKKEEAVMNEGQLMKIMALEIGEQLHVDAWRRGWASDVFVGTALLAMYSKCGIISESENMFIAMPQRDTAAWNAMLSSFVEHGQGSNALKLYRQMQEEGISPNCSTFIGCLQACGYLMEREEGIASSLDAGTLDIVYSLHVDACRKGYASDTRICNILVRIYGKCNAIDDAEEVFCQLSHRTVVTWTALMSAYVDQGQGTRALMQYRQMQENDVSPNELTFVATLQACGILIDMLDEEFLVKDVSANDICKEIMQALYMDAKENGHASDILVNTTIISVYGKCGCIDKAESIFNSFVSPNVDLCNALLSLYVSHGKEDVALEMYSSMLKGLGTLSYGTLICMFEACSEVGYLDLCFQLHCHAVCGGYELVPSLLAALIQTYGASANMNDGQTVFDLIPIPQSNSWTACVAGYAAIGNSNAASVMLEDLRLVGLNPNGATVTSAMSACSRTGLVTLGIEYFHSLSRDHGISPTSKHYAIILDLFGRIGDFRRVTHIMDQLPKEPDIMIWLCILGACRLHGNLELGTSAFEHAVYLQPSKAVSYVLMSNIHADAWSNNLMAVGSDGPNIICSNYR